MSAGWSGTGCATSRIPATGKRVSRPNPEDAWIVTDVPDLRIVDDALWERVKARQSAAALPRGANRGKALSRANRPRHLFSGLLACGCCGGGMSMISATHVGCSTARNKGTCANRRTMARGELERRVLGALSERLMDPALFGVFCEEFTAETNRLRGAASARVAESARELARVTAAIDRLVQAIVDGAPARAVTERMEELEAETLRARGRRGRARGAGSDAASGDGRGLPRARSPISRARSRRPTRGTRRRTSCAGWSRRSNCIRARTATRSCCAAIWRGSCGWRVNGKKPATVSGGGLSQMALVAGTGFEPVTFRL